jgi:hypothetical protein
MPKLPTLIMATKHDLQPLPDVQVNGFAVVRLGHRDLPVRSVGARRRSATGCERAKQSHDDHKPDRTHIDMT